MFKMDRKRFVLYLHIAFIVFHIADCRSITPNVTAAYRVCKLGPFFPAPQRGNNCLIIGDSIAIGYTKYVEDSLQHLCQVQHSPFDFNYGGALDTSYGLQCLRLWLKTLNQESTRYDAIIFNFGLHDVCCFIGPHEEFVSPAKYTRNLKMIKKHLVGTGSTVGYLLTTPVPFSKTKDLQVIRYNAMARKVMSEKPTVAVLDLHERVVHKCGNPSYRNCSISLEGPRNPHYNKEGDKLLGKAVSDFLKNLLLQRKQLKLVNKPAKVMNRGRPFVNDFEPTIECRNGSGRIVGVCPVGTTCSPQAHSVTKSGCCLLPDAVVCHDSYHCCPRGWLCDPLCSITTCRCTRED